MTSGGGSEYVGNDFWLRFVYFIDKEWFTITIGVALISENQFVFPLLPSIFPRANIFLSAKKSNLK
jgi:hypothetical protein